MGDMRAFYETLKAVFGPSHQIQCPPRLSDGKTMQINKEAILQCWSAYFEGRLIPRVHVKLEPCDLLTREDKNTHTQKATMQHKLGKSSGMNGISAEVCPYGGEAVLKKLQNLFTNSSEKGTLPRDLRDAVIVSVQ